MESYHKVSFDDRYFLHIRLDAPHMTDLWLRAGYTNDNGYTIDIGHVIIPREYVQDVVTAMLAELKKIEGVVEDVSPDES